MPDLGQIHHLAYVVTEIEPVVERLHAQFRAGPFLRIEDVPVMDVTSRGEPAEFVHDAAFGICNDLPVELLQVTGIEPAEVAARFLANDDGTPRLQHVAYALPPATVEEARADLDANCLPEYLRARFGEDAEMTYHDASGSFGHDLEIHATARACAPPSRCCVKPPRAGTGWTCCVRSGRGERSYPAAIADWAAATRAIGTR